MPCNSDYLEANNLEIEASKIVALLDELEGKPIPDDYGSGYDDRVYNQAIDLDKLTAKLCKRLQKVDVSEYSLEMQIWWRDHQKADKARLEQEQKRLTTDKQKAAALKKLTKYERKLLGL